MARINMTEGTSALKANKARFTVVEGMKKTTRSGRVLAKEILCFQQDTCYDLDEYDFQHKEESKVSSFIVMGVCAVAALLFVIVPALF